MRKESDALVKGRLDPPANNKERVARWKNNNWEEKTLYEEDLPPPLATVEVVTVVPAYNEYANGSFWELLSGAASQTADAKTFEVIVVVNNTLEEAEEKTAAYKDNQKFLAVARELKEAMEGGRGRFSKSAAQRSFARLEREGIVLTDWQKEIFGAAVRKQVRFYAVDASGSERATHSRYGGDYVQPAGAARHIGGRVAYRRYVEATGSDSGLIDFVDADCGFPPNYHETLIAAGREAPEQGAFFKEVVTYAPEVPAWEGLSPLARVGHLIHFLRQNITHRRQMFLSNGLYWAPSATVRGSRFKSVGGYHYDNLNEDLIFAGNVLNSGGAKPIRGTHVRLSDRASKRGFDGQIWHSSKLNENFFTSPAAFKEHFDPTNLLKLEGQYYDYAQFAGSLLMHDEMLSPFSGPYRSFRKKYWDAEVKKSKRRVAFYRETLRALIPVLQKAPPDADTFTNEMRYRAWLEKNFKTSLNARTFDAMARNPVVMASLAAVCELMQSAESRAALGVDGKNLEEAVWSFFKTYLPEYFTVLPEEEPDYGLMRKELDATGRLPEGYSLGSLVHLIRAKQTWENKNR